VREATPPNQGAPLHWILLSSWPCEDLAQARRVVGAYGARWLIEEYHKVLKTGSRIEDSQRTTAESLEALLAIHAVTAVDLLQLKLLARAKPDGPVDTALLSDSPRAVLEHHTNRPENGWTYDNALRAIARLGGYLDRKSDGPPGWLAIWRGWLYLEAMVQGYELAKLQQ